MHNLSSSNLGRAVRTVSRIASTMPIGIAAALVLALGLAAALVQPLRAEAAPARAAGVLYAVVPRQTPTPTVPVATPTSTLPPTPTVPVATPTATGSTGTSSACPSLDPSSGCTFFGVPDWLLAVLAAALILILILVAAAASGRRSAAHDDARRDRPRY
jgi:hypothetical protein